MDSLTGRNRHLEQIYGSGYVRTQVLAMESKDGLLKLEPHEAGSIHQLYVIHGRIEAGAEKELFTLAANDFLRFPGDVEHYYRSLTERTLAHLVTTAPQVPQIAGGALEGAAWPS